MTTDNQTLTDCPVCCSHASERYFERHHVTLERCLDCQVVWWNAPPSRATTKAYFQNEYITDEERLTEKFIDYRSDALNKIAQHVKQSAGSPLVRLLDIGTASGSFLNIIKTLGVTDVMGVEPSTYAAQSVRDRLGLTVYSGFIEDQTFENESFDIVTCLDTLCLVSEPHTDVTEMSRVLKPGGHCFIELPGFTYRMLKGKGPLGQLIYGDKTGIQLGVHTLYFQRKSLARLFEQHGFSLVKSLPIGGPIYGSGVRQFIKHRFFAALGLAYHAVGGSVEISPKVLYHFRKHA